MNGEKYCLDAKSFLRVFITVIIIYLGQVKLFIANIKLTLMYNYNNNNNQFMVMVFLNYASVSYRGNMYSSKFIHLILHNAMIMIL